MRNSKIIVFFWHHPPPTEGPDSWLLSMVLSNRAQVTIRCWPVLTWVYIALEISLFSVEVVHRKYKGCHYTMFSTHYWRCKHRSVHHVHMSYKEANSYTSMYTYMHTCIREGKFPKASHKTAKRSTQFRAQCVTGCADCALQRIKFLWKSMNAAELA